MLIKWMTMEDKPDWISLAEEVAPVFNAPDMARDPEFHQYMDAKLSKYEALMAVNRMTKEVLGVIGFSRTYNRITWLGVFEKARRKGVGYKLLKCALNQLDWTKDITVETYRTGYEPGEAARRLYQKLGFIDVDTTLFDKLNNPRSKMAIAPSQAKRGASFHYHYAEYAKMANPEGCPVCQSQAAPNPPVILKELDYSWVECYEEAQGRLFGKCHVLSKKHSEHFYDMSKEDMSNFMSDVQKAAQALHQVTEAVKINYEIHGNSMPHLHIHLFPRYLEDDFPSAPIDYRLVEPSPYESHEEFLWFVAKMRELLAK